MDKNERKPTLPVPDERTYRHLLPCQKNEPTSNQASVFSCQYVKTTQEKGVILNCIVHIKLAKCGKFFMLNTQGSSMSKA